MIFSKFFKAQWQHKNSNVRITAINESLSVSNPEQKQILITLSKTDENELVRRAALIKLADFSVWLEAKNNNDNNKVQNFAQQQVEKIIHNQHELKINLEQKQQYLQQNNKSQELEAWLKIENDPQLIIALYEKIEKPQLALTLFEQKNIVEVQEYLINNIEQLDTLEKCLKKSKNNKVTQLISSKITHLIEATEKPIKLKKKVQLILSKLLALKDVSDFSVVVTKRQTIENEWQEYLHDSNCLTDDEQKETLEKYNDISEMLGKVFAQKEEDYQQQLIEQKLQQDKLLARQTFDKALTQLSTEIANAIFEENKLDEDKFEASMAALTNQIQESVLNDTEKKNYIGKVEQHKNTLSKAPIIAQSVTEATHLISRISQLALPATIDELNERQPIFNEWLTQWQLIEKQSVGFLPDTITHAVKEIKQHWRKGLAPLLEQQKSSVNQIQKKLSELKRLIASGKYNACFGVFKRIEKLYQQLSSKQQLKIQRDYDEVSEKIKDLSDLESFIATPRKKELLTEIQSIIDTPLDNPNEQAEKVKLYRKQWNLLGHAEDDVEKPLNEAFNLACEQAFAPCRLYYNEQEKIREQHLITREKLLIQAEALAGKLTTDNSNQDWKSLDGQLNKIQQQWNEAGEVDRSKYQALHLQFNAHLQPVKNAIKAFHQDNVEKKKALIAKAETALQDEDIFAAINHVKSLQSDWRNIGYCGPREENKLWQTFRKINDSVFAKREEVKEAEKSQYLVLEAQFQTAFAELKLQDQADIHALKESKASAQQLLSSIFNQKPFIKSVSHKVEQYLKELDEKIIAFNKQKSAKNWHNIFDFLELVATNAVDKNSAAENSLFQEISITWQKKIQDVLKDSTTVNRDLKTLELEIFAGVESPKEFKQQRMEVQVGLMQEQMLAGTEVNLEKSLIDWLLLGQITEQDLSLLLRIKPIYCH